MNLEKMNTYYSLKFHGLKIEKNSHNYNAVIMQCYG